MAAALPWDVLEKIITDPRDLCRAAVLSRHLRGFAESVRPSHMLIDESMVKWLTHGPHFTGPRSLKIPSLEQLVEIRLTKEAEYVYIMPFVRWLGTAELPCLRSVIIARRPWGGLPMDNALTLLPTQLTKINFIGQCRGQLGVRCLSRFPLLTDLALKSTERAVGLFPPLPHLTRLRFYYYGGLTVRQLLQEGTFPVLASLEMYLRAPDADPFGLTKESFKALLENMPGLASLRISVKGGKPIEGLSYPAELPPLKRVEIKGHWHEPEAVTFPRSGYSFESSIAERTLFYLSD